MGRSDFQARLWRAFFRPAAGPGTEAAHAGLRPKWQKVAIFSGTNNAFSLSHHMKCLIADNKINGYQLNL